MGIISDYKEKDLKIERLKNELIFILRNSNSLIEEKDLKIKNLYKRKLEGYILIGLFSFMSGCFFMRYIFL